jgi:hypothetical protein
MATSSPVIAPSSDSRRRRAFGGFTWNGASRLGAQLRSAEIRFFHVTVAARLAHQGFVGSGVFGVVEGSLRF